MRCKHHPLRGAIGYCCKCGAFGCKDCLSEHGGELYCKHDYKSISDEFEKKRKHEKTLARRERQRLVVRKKDGEVACGVCFALNPANEEFHLNLVDKGGETLGKTSGFLFAELKAIYFVKSFDGKFDESHKYHEPDVKGSRVVLEFEDNEIFHGHTLRPYRREDLRFYIIPEEKNSNNISVLVERSALRQVYTPKEYRDIRHGQITDYITKHKVQGYSKPELTGDFYFEKREYRRAFKYYMAASREESASPRIRKKMISAQYNVAKEYIKYHEFYRAVSAMKILVELDPENERAKEKLRKLRKYIKHKQLLHAGKKASNVSL